MKYKIIYGSTAEKDLIRDYEAILYSASTELSEDEFQHLADIADIGYEHATKKDDYVEALHETVSAWISETRRAELFLIKDSTAIDFEKWYNEASEVKTQMKSNKEYNFIPAFFVYFGAVVLALFCVFLTIFVVEIRLKFLFINPVYLFMFTVGFLGLLLTDVVAIVEWRKGWYGKKQSEA